LLNFSYLFCRQHVGPDQQEGSGRKRKEDEGNCPIAPNQDLKLKVVATATPTPTEDDKETYFGPIFKRRRKTTTTPSELTTSDGRAPSHHQTHPHYATW